MHPYIDIGPLHLGTFGLLLWLAAVAGTLVLHWNFKRFGVAADALNIVAVVVVAGVVGAKLWHELQDLHELRLSLELIGQPGWQHPGEVLLRFFHWFQNGFAWFGGMAAGILALMVEGRKARYKGPGWKSLDDPGPTPGPALGPIRMLDLAAPAAALGYGIGRIGCLLSGDGDYGVNTTLPWGVHMAKNALVPPNPPDALVQPTPVYELLFSIALFWLLWTLAKKTRPVGWITGVYLACAGVGRFLVEFVRVNPKLYFHHTLSNAQVAALITVLAGVIVVGVAQSRGVETAPMPKAVP